MSLARLAPAVLLAALRAWSGEAARPSVDTFTDLEPSNSEETAARALLSFETQLNLAKIKANRTAVEEHSLWLRVIPSVDELAQLFSVNATELPELAMRAAAYPVMVHPSGAMAMAVWDLAGRANVSNLWGTSPMEALMQVANVLQVSEGPGEAQVMVSTFYVGLFIAFSWILCLGLVLTPVLVFCYKSRVADRRPQFPAAVPDEVSMEESEDFHHSIFTCCFPGSTCLFACFCPCVRHADTLAATGLGGFWSTIFVWLIIDTIASAAAAASGGTAVPLQGLLLALVYAPSRQALRGKFGGPDRGTFTDYLYWCLCPECSVAQEGLQVDSAQGVEVRCFCSMYDKATGEYVGEPIKAEG